VYNNIIMDIIYDKEASKANGESKGIAYISEVYNEDDEYEETIKAKANGESKTTAYIREWKRKDYQKNGEKIKAKNRAYYYKYKFNLTCEDMKTYDIHLPLVAKVWDSLEKLKKENPELVSKCLEKYIS
jgi:hypothetical protein